MKFERKKWRSVTGVFRNSERICQRKCVLAVLREAISLGCVVLFCSAVVQAQTPVESGVALANPNRTIRSSQGLSISDKLKEKKRTQNKRSKKPVKIASNRNPLDYAAKPGPLSTPLANTFGQGDLYTPSMRAPLIKDYSLIYVPAPEPIVVKVHDIISIMVDEKSSVTVDSRYNRNRQEILKAELKEFLRIDEKGNLAPAALNSPKIDAQLQGRLQSTGQLEDREGIQYRIAAIVVDIRPNGNLILEARKSIRTNRDVWEYRLTGEIRSKDVNRDNTAISENIANLDIVKYQRGKVYDSTKRPWGVVLYDLIFPF